MAIASAAASIVGGVLGNNESAAASAENINDSAWALLRATQKSNQLFDIAQEGIAPFTTMAAPALADIRAMMDEDSNASTAYAQEQMIRSQRMGAAALGKLGSGEHLRKVTAGANEIAQLDMNRRYGMLLDSANLGRNAAGAVGGLASGTAGAISGIETGTQTTLNALRTMQADMRAETFGLFGKAAGDAANSR